MTMRVARRRTLIPLAAVLALHALVIALLNTSGTRTMPRASAPSDRVTLRLISNPPAVAAVAPQPAAADSSLRPSQRMPTPTRRRPAESLPAPTVVSPETTNAPTITAIAPEPPASAPAVMPSLLDSAATRRAISASARAPSLGDQLSRSREEPSRVSANERLANNVREAGKGDCAKGEYAGGGMGLLSLPFLAIAAAAGNCAK